MVIHPVKQVWSLLAVPLLALLLLASGWAQAGDGLVEGRDYALVEQPAAPLPGKPEIIEASNFQCPHCFELQGQLVPWSARNHERYTVRMLPIYWGQQTDAPVRAYYAAEFLGKGEAMKLAIFKGHFKDKRNIENPDELMKLAKEAGLDPKQLQERMGDFGVLAKVAQGKARQESLGITVTPSLVVNGRYRVTPVHSQGDYAKMLKIVETLAAR